MTSKIAQIMNNKIEQTMIKIVISRMDTITKSMISNVAYIRINNTA